MDTPQPFEEGYQLGRYKLLYPVGAGGFAELWKAECEDGSFRVIKRPIGPAATKPEGHAMLLDESRYTGGLDHPNVVRSFEVIDIGGGVPALVMEYVGGPPLRRILDRMNKLEMVFDMRVAFSVVARVCAGLDHAHMARDAMGEPMGIVHRDVTPSNVMLRADGRVKLIDFGIVMAEHRRTVTTAGFIKGNPYYIAPEQALGKEVDPRTDVYSAGAILYELLTGVRPYHGLTAAEVLIKLASGEMPPRPSHIDDTVSGDAEALVLQSMAADPDRRFSSAAAFRYALEEMLPKGPAGEDVLADMVGYLFPEGAEPPPMQGSAPVSDDGSLPVQLIESHRSLKGWWRNIRKK